MKGLSKTKARKILHNQSVRGHPLTEKQRRFFGARAHGSTATHPKNPPLFHGGASIGPELEPFNTARWEEPLLGPEDAQVGRPGDLINQGSLFRNPGTDPKPDGKQQVSPKVGGEPKQQEAALVDEDFHNRGRDDFRKRTDKAWTGDLSKWDGVIPGGGAS